MADKLTKSERIAALEEKVLGLQLQVDCLRSLLAGQVTPQPAMPWTWPGPGVLYCSEGGM